jgi:hypothetical protein
MDNWLFSSKFVDIGGAGLSIAPYQRLTNAVLRLRTSGGPARRPLMCLRQGMQVWRGNWVEMVNGSKSCRVFDVMEYGGPQLVRPGSSD